jgi:hypothetical protein
MLLDESLGVFGEDGIVVCLVMAAFAVIPKVESVYGSREVTR